MSSLMARAAAATTEVVRGVAPDQLDLPTPCADFTVRQVINHLVVWSGLQSERSARKLPADPTLTDATAVTVDAGDALQRAVTAWSEAGALDGEAFLAGTALPANLVHAAFLSELVLHGWDLATATGQRLRVDEDVAQATYEVLVMMAAQGREFGIYGPEVPVSSAEPLTKALGLSGRNPG